MQKLKQQQLFDRVFEKLPDHVTLLLIILCGFLLARLTWMMFPADPRIASPLVQEQENAVGGVSVIQAHARSTDLGKEIAGYHLLGVYKPPQKKVEPKPVVQQAKAPPPQPKKPRIPLKLVGVYALSAKDGIAVIDVKGQQQVIGLGEKIGDSGAVLTKVLHDRVEVSWEDGQEAQTLEMPNIGKSALGAIQIPPGQQLKPEPAVQQAQTGAGAATTTVANRGNQNNKAVAAGLSNAAGGTQGTRRPANQNNRLQNQNNGTFGNQQPQTGGVLSNNPVSSGLDSSGTNNQANAAGAGVSLSDFRQQVVNNNINLLKIVRPSPARRNGQQIGFRIRPGTNRALFRQTGLKSGDIVTAINGMPLTNNASSMQAMQGLVSSAGATLTVQRAGQETTVQVNF